MTVNTSTLVRIDHNGALILQKVVENCCNYYIGASLESYKALPVKMLLHNAIVGITMEDT